MMGVVYQASGDYSLGYVLLAITAAVAAAVTATAVRSRATQRTATP
jgi:MFS transporter, NNP family, nitrate/nitrite transporter